MVLKQFISKLFFCIRIDHRILAAASKAKVIQLCKFGFYTGADLGFSRGGGRIFKKISKILTTFFFFRSTKLIFRALPKHGFVPILAKFFAPQAKFWKKQAKKGVFRHFLENFDRKIAFFRPAVPSQN